MYSRGRRAGFGNWAAIGQGNWCLIGKRCDVGDTDWLGFLHVRLRWSGS